MPPPKQERPESTAKPRGEAKRTSNTQPNNPTKSNTGAATVENDAQPKQSHKFKMPNQKKNELKQKQVPDATKVPSNDPPTKYNDATTPADDIDSPPQQAHKFKMPKKYKKPLKQEQAPNGETAEDDDDDPKKCVIT